MNTRAFFIISSLFGSVRLGHSRKIRENDFLCHQIEGHQEQTFRHILKFVRKASCVVLVQSSELVNGKFLSSKHILLIFFACTRKRLSDLYTKGRRNLMRRQTQSQPKRLLDHRIRWVFSDVSFSSQFSLAGTVETRKQCDFFSSTSLQEVFLP